MHARAVRRLTLETELRKAVELGQLSVYYQPIVALNNGRIIGFEALSRWRRSDGLVPPGEFIPVADETGLIIAINRALLQDACRQLRSWQTEFPSDPPLIMSVNVAPKQFAQQDLRTDIALTIKQTAVPPDTLQLEILETTAMRDAERAVNMLSELRSVGVRLSIDDFGTGYSSLSRLQRLPVDCLKIDRSFICKMDEDRDSQEIVRMIIAMAHALGIKVVAEGTETEMQSSTLRRLGCEMAQGYLFSRPAPAEVITDLLHKTNSDISAFPKT
jgi:EAL domain-containing protein (putative c-di-GMP-specific phosphodiesterase class I)